jgi:Tfp pilus assembly ATPase PilU
MQTSTGRGMTTMEQSLANLVLRRVITREAALAVSSRVEQLDGLLERAGFEDDAVEEAPLHAGLRVAGS